MTKLAIKELHEVTGNFKDVDTVLVNRFELRRLQDQNEEMLSALEKIIEMNRATAREQFGDSEQAERWACVTIARAAIAKAGGAA